MIEIALEQLPAQVQELFGSVNQEHVLVSRDGKPFAVVFGVQFKDQEDYQLQSDSEFWRMIEERRREPTIPLEQVKAELFGSDS